MVYFLCKFQFVSLLWTASAKLLKKLQFLSFQWVSLPFSCSYSALGRSIRVNCWNSSNFHAFPTAGKPHFYDFIALRGPNPVSFVHCQGFLRNLSMSLHTNRWHMAYFLCKFQGFPLLWAASAKLLKKLQFPCLSHCSKASLLWSHCAQTQFLSSIAKVSCGIWVWHYIQTDGPWLIFFAIFKVFLCVVRLLPNCWKSCSFHHTMMHSICFQAEFAVFFLPSPQIAQLPGFLLRRRELAVSTATLDARYCCFVNLLLFILLRPVLYNGPDADDAVAPVTVDAASVIGRLLLLLVLPLACWLAVKSLC